MSPKICPRCKNSDSLTRASKKGFARFLAKFTEVHHYRCDTFSCGWSGLILPRFNNKTLTQVLFPYLFGTIFIGIAAIGGHSLFSNYVKQSNQRSKQPSYLDSHTIDLEKPTTNANYK